MYTQAFAVFFPTGVIKILGEKNRPVITRVQTLFHDGSCGPVHSIWQLAKVHLPMSAIVEPPDGARAHLREVMGIWDVIIEENGGPGVLMAMVRLLADPMLKKFEGALAEEAEENQH